MRGKDIFIYVIKNKNGRGVSHPEGSLSIAVQLPTTLSNEYFAWQFIKKKGENRIMNKKSLIEIGYKVALEMLTG